MTGVFMIRRTFLVAVSHKLGRRPILWHDRARLTAGYARAAIAFVDAAAAAQASGQRGLRATAALLRWRVTRYGARVAAR